jgi:signal transduction histidine kinase
LNSISSQNIENKVLYEKISKILDSEFIEDFQIENLKQILVKLKRGREVQYASTKLMNSLIQDLLDYAQIQAGKFRKNLKMFNLENTV